MNSDIPLKTTPIFLANLYLKQDISSEFAMVNFICIGLLDLWGARTENYKIKNSWRQWDSNPGPSAYEAKSLSVAVLDQIYVEHLNIDRVLPECAIKIYLYCVPRGRCSKMFCRVLHFINSSQSANVLLVKQQNDTNMTKLHDK